MEVRETAACGISQRQFALECGPDELPGVYRLLRRAAKGVGHIEEELLEELQSQMEYIVGPSVGEEPLEGTDGIHWQENNGLYALLFAEGQAGHLWRLLLAAGGKPEADPDSALAERLMGQMMELAPSLLDNLPVINR